MTLNPADYGQAPPAEGWFPDPTSPGHERRWDGTSWTNETRESAKSQLVEPTALASPDQLNAAILSAEAYSELVDLAPPTLPASVPLLSVATAPKRDRKTRRLVGGLSLLLVFAGVIAVIVGVYGLVGVLAMQTTAAILLAVAGAVVFFAGIVVGAIRTRR